MFGKYFDQRIFFVDGQVPLPIISISLSNGAAAMVVVVMLGLESVSRIIGGMALVARNQLGGTLIKMVNVTDMDS